MAILTWKQVQHIHGPPNGCARRQHLYRRTLTIELHEVKCQSLVDSGLGRCIATCAALYSMLGFMLMHSANRTSKQLAIQSVTHASSIRQIPTGPKHGMHTMACIIASKYILSVMVPCARRTILVPRTTNPDGSKLLISDTSVPDHRRDNS
jgi:hypothetical protein